MRYIELTARARRFLARRPWVYWCIVGVLILTAANSVAARVDRADQARADWTDMVSVWVATVDVTAGGTVYAEQQQVPRAVVPDRPAESVTGTTARHHIGRGEIIALADVAATEAPAAMIPEGWLGVPISERPASAAVVGDRVAIATDGVVLFDDAIVVARHDAVVTVAVPTDVAAVVAFAALETGVSVLLRP